MKTKNHSLRTLIIVAILGSAIHFNSHAQVKVGSNPTTIDENSNLEIEAANGRKLVVDKSNGHITSSNPSGNTAASLRLEQNSNQYSILSHASLRINQVVGTAGTNNTGGSIELTGRGNSWTIGQFTSADNRTFLGITRTATMTSTMTSYPFYVHDNNKVSIGGHFTNNSAALSVNGSMFASGGYITRRGTGGAISNSVFNFAWQSPYVEAWIDNVRIGNVQMVSDYRAKKNISLISNSALSRVKQLKPVSYEFKDTSDNIFKADGIVHEGFIAHELQEIIPSAVTGKKDALTADGKIQPQTLNAMPVIAILTKAIQELENKLEAQNQKIAMLEEQYKRVAALKDQIIKMSNLVSQLDEKRLTQTSR